MPWNTAEWKAKLVKSILAFANVRDGGSIVIGVAELDGGDFDFTGMEEEHFATYSQDDVDSEVAKFADPYVKLSLHKVTVDEKKYNLLQVEEFGEIPVVCKRDGPCNLRKGAVFTRAYGKAETVEVPSQTEMREILDVATEKAIRKLLATMYRVGALNPPLPPPSADERYGQQRSDLE